MQAAPTQRCIAFLNDEIGILSKLLCAFSLIHTNVQSYMLRPGNTYMVLVLYVHSQIRIHRHLSYGWYDHAEAWVHALCILCTCHAPTHPAERFELQPVHEVIAQQHTMHSS